VRPLARRFDLGAIVGLRRAVVEGHRDVGAERGLDLRHALGSEAHARAVDHRAERHTVGVDRARVGQAEHLVAAGIGQDRTVPIHEAVQAAELGDQLLARP